SDDAAVRVLAAIGDDPLGAGQFFLSLLPDPQACKSAVEAGKSTPYGRFIDPHNDTCWRYFHAFHFAKALAACPKEPPPTERATRGSGNVSPYDKKPSEMLGK